MMLTAWCLLAALAGGVGWTLAEYLLHRFAGHRRGSRTLFAREHLRHHRELDWFSPAWRKIALAAMIFVVGAPVGWVLLGLPGALAVVGFLAAYATYEVGHERLHSHPPRSAWGRWARRHHWFHHAVDPSSNHGVTTALWDVVFRTHRPEVVVLHRGRAPGWLLDDGGAVRSEFRGQFELA